MCGIWGFVKKHPGVLSKVEQDFIQQAAIVGQVRGEDGIGMFVVYENGQVRALRGVSIPNNFIKSQEYWDLFFKKGKDDKPELRRIKAVFGHNRAATKGKVISKNCHPFRVNNIMLMHNGTLRNTLPQGIDVDSMWIAKLMSEKSPQEVINTINGAYALVWYNDKDKVINLVRNHERPLAYTETHADYFFASERPMLQWLVERNISQYNLKYFSVATDTLFSMKVDSDKWEESQLKKIYATTNYSPPSSKDYSYPHPGKYKGKSERETIKEKWEKEYRQPDEVPETVEFKIVGSDIKELDNGERVYYYYGTNLEKHTHKNVLLVYKDRLPFHPKTTFLAEVAGFVRKNNKKYLLAKSHSVVDMGEEKPQDVYSLADGTTITHAEFQRNPHCVSCSHHLDERDLEDSYRTSQGLLCNSCLEHYCDNHTKEVSNVHYLQ